MKGDWLKRFASGAPGQAKAKARKIAWMDFVKGGIVVLNGQDFQIASVGKDTLTLKAVEFLDPSVKTKGRRR